MWGGHIIYTKYVTALKKRNLITINEKLAVKMKLDDPHPHIIPHLVVQ